MYWPWCPPGILLHVNARTKKGDVESMSQIEEVSGCACSSTKRAEKPKPRDMSIPVSSGVSGVWEESAGKHTLSA